MTPLHSDLPTRFTQARCEELERKVRELLGLLKERDDRLTEIRRVVDKQAKDEGLWFVAKTAPEAYLQEELRYIHHVIEEDDAI